MKKTTLSSKTVFLCLVAIVFLASCGKDDTKPKSTNLIVVDEGAGAPRILVSGTGDNAVLHLTKKQNYEATLFQFGSVIGWDQSNNLTPAFNPTTNEISSWNANWVSTTEHSIENLKVGKGDPCKLLGYKVSDIRSMLKADILPDNKMWRMPTMSENMAFAPEGTRTKWDTFEGFNGLYFPNATSESNWLPAAGSRNSESGAFSGAGSAGNYWSISIRSSRYGNYLFFNNLNVFPSTDSQRAYGFPVRCVTQK